MGTAFLGLVAGLLSPLSPCILPLLPIILVAASNTHRYGSLALVAGLASAFTGVGLLLSGAVWALDISDDTIRAISAALLILFGMILMSSVLRTRFAAITAPLSAQLNGPLTRFTPDSLGGQFALGALLGAAWVPCAGPTLGAAVSLAASSDTLFAAVIVMVMFSVGAAVPLLVIAYGSRKALVSRRASLADIGRWATPLLGGVLLTFGAMILAGWDRSIQAALVNAMPDWLIYVTTRF
jgi:cytochrome c-type biogenesis protein